MTYGSKDNISARAAAISVALEAMVRSRASDARRRKSMAMAMIGFVVAGALTGGAVSASVVDRPDVTSDESNIVELIRTVGEPEARRVGDPILFAGSGDAEIPLGMIPEGVTQLAIAFDCVDPGTYEIAVGEVDGGFGASCDAGNTAANLGGVFTASPTLDRAIHISAALGDRWSLRAVWITGLPDGWEVNANGQTFGPGVDGTAPDLIMAVGVDAAGNPIDGYVVSADALRPKAASLEEGAAQEAADEAAHPNGRDVPLYASDGVTVLGSAHIGRTQ